MILNFDIYDVPTAVKYDDIPAEILRCPEVKYCIDNIQAEKNIQLVRIEHHCYGKPDGEDETDSWQVISYQPSTEWFIINTYDIFYECGERKVIKNAVNIDGSVMGKLWDKVKDMGVVA
jgi:hypothetical protein